MLKKSIYISFIFMSFLHGATLTTDRDTYSNNQQIVVTYSDIESQDHDWIGIYPSDKSNDWGNQVQWNWTGDKEGGTLTFPPLSAGTYDVRLFYNNSFTLETSKQITVDDNGAVATVVTSKEVYTPQEPISAIFNNMSGDNQDWIAVYPKGSTSDWGNQLAWKWIEGDISGEREFGALPVGEYEVRVFFHNSFNVAAEGSFKVESAVVVDTLILSKEIYDSYELIHVDYNNMTGSDTDWIGVFPVGANNDKNSTLEWRDTKGLVSGALSFNGLVVGAYEVRAFFGDAHQKTVGFTVRDEEAVRTLYDDFEDGIDPRWTKYFGRDMLLLNVGVPDGGAENTERKVIVNGQHSLRTYNSDGLAQSAGYYFDFQSPDAKMKFLEIDVSVGVSSHRFAFGVKVKTKFGDRRMEFASWLNHTMPSGQQIIKGPYGNVLEGHREVFTQDNYLYVHPAPSDYFVGTSAYVTNETNKFVHYKINIEEKLRILEPDNELLEITLFTTSGGDYDNLALSSQ